MAFDPTLAMQVKGIDIPDPLDIYAKAAAIQGAQNQNALAQYQLSSAKRADALAENRMAVLRSAGTDLNKVANALLQTGDLKGYDELMKGQKSQTDLIDSKLKQSRSFLDTIDPNDPNAPQQYLKWHQANHADPVLGPALAARGVTPEQSLTRINQAIQAGPQAFAQLLAQSKLGAEKFIELNKPSTHVIDQGGQRQVIQVPGMGGAPVTVGTYSDVAAPADVEAQKARIASAGAARLNVSTEKKYGEQFANQIAQADAAKLAAAEAAPRVAANADRILDLLEGGKVITGTGAEYKLKLAKVFNLGGKTDSEKIANTELLLSSLANNTLGHIKSSGLGSGQGFTDKDREFLEKASSGNITFGNESLMKLARISRNVAEQTATQWNKRAQQIPQSAIQGTGLSTEPIVISPRKAKGQASPSNIPAVETIRGGHFYKGGNENNWEKLKPPPFGTIIGGYRYKGGNNLMDAGNENNWEKQ